VNNKWSLFSESTIWMGGAIIGRNDWFWWEWKHKAFEILHLFPDTFL